jgi:hypothetical protein|tara:strand:+ start:694 stop:1131 length:438 start_codon:yes stop_codon:yes gene_type:complete
MQQCHEPPHFNIRWEGQIVRLEFERYETSPMAVTRAVSAVRQAIEYRDGASWVEVCSIADPRGSSLPLRQFFASELEWKVRNGCIGVAICADEQSFESTSRTFHSNKYKGLVKVFSDLKECYGWANSKLSANDAFINKSKSNAVA